MNSKWIEWRIWWLVNVRASWPIDIQQQQTSSVIRGNGSLSKPHTGNNRNIFLCLHPTHTHSLTRKSIEQFRINAETKKPNFPFQVYFCIDICSCFFSFSQWIRFWLVFFLSLFLFDFKNLYILLMLQVFFFSRFKYNGFAVIMNSNHVFDIKAPADRWNNLNSLASTW